MFIFPIRWGLKGAAIATGISQTIELIIVREMPKCIAQFLTPITTILINRTL